MGCGDELGEGEEEEEEEEVGEKIETRRCCCCCCWRIEPPSLSNSLFSVTDTHPVETVSKDHTSTPFVFII